MWLVLCVVRGLAGIREVRMSVQRAKGTRFESEIVEYLKANGFPYAERRAMRGNRDAA